MEKAYVNEVIQRIEKDPLKKAELDKARGRERPYANGPLDRRVGGEAPIFALFDPDGNLLRCGETLDIATNYLVEGMPAGMWNALFGSPEKTRVKVFERHGWKVLQGTFTPNAGIER